MPQVQNQIASGSCIQKTSARTGQNLGILNGKVFGTSRCGYSNRYVQGRKITRQRKWKVAGSKPVIIR